MDCGNIIKEEKKGVFNRKKITLHILILDFDPKTIA